MPSPQQTVSLLIILSLGLGSGGCAVLQNLGGKGSSAGFRPGQVKVFPVSLKTLESQSLQESSVFIGTLKAAQRVVLKPEAAGRITDIFVQSGRAVTPGTPILRLSPERSEASVTAAQSRVDAAKAAKNTQEAQWRSAQARVKQLEADLVLQRTNLARIQNLVKEGAFAQQSLDQAIRDRDSAAAALNAARQEVTAAAASVEEAKASLAQAEAQVRSVQQDLKDTTVNAPIAGVVGNLDLKLGDYVKVGDILTTLTNNKTLEVELPIPVEYRSKIHLDLPVKIRNYNTETNVAEGKIDFISPTVDPATQSILIKAKVDNAQGTLQDAQQVEAQIIWDTKPGVVVPTDAVVRLGGQTFIFVAKQKDQKLTAEQRAIELGSIEGNNYKILSGLKAGEQIVISGMLNLSDGAAIQVQDQSKKP